MVDVTASEVPGLEDEAAEVPDPEDEAAEESDQDNEPAEEPEAEDLAEHDWQDETPVAEENSEPEADAGDTPSEGLGADRAQEDQAGDDPADDDSAGDDSADDDSADDDPADDDSADDSAEQTRVDTAVVEPEEGVSEPPIWERTHEEPAPDNFAVAAPAFPPSTEPASALADQDGPTRGGWQDDDPLSRPLPGMTPAADAPADGPAVARLQFSSGEVVEVDRPILVGRSPEVRRFATHDRPLLIPVPSPHQEISSTHLEIRPGVGADHGSAVVTDLGSTNGTVLVQPSLPPEDLQPGIAVQLVPGAIIDLGDGVTIQVTQP